MWLHGHASLPTMRHARLAARPSPGCPPLAPGWPTSWLPRAAPPATAPAARHPFCMALGFIFFMGEGLVSAWAIRTTAGEERVRGLEMHALMQVGAGTGARRGVRCRQGCAHAVHAAAVHAGEGRSKGARACATQGQAKQGRLLAGAATRKPHPAEPQRVVQQRPLRLSAQVLGLESAHA